MEPVETIPSFFAAARLAVLTAACLLASPALSQPPPLPDKMKPPAERPAPAGEEAPASAVAPEVPPVPHPRPDRAAGKQDEEEEKGRTQAKTTLPAGELSCRSRLRALGVEFVEAQPINEPEGCEAAHPIRVSSLSDDVVLRPDAVMTCAMAEATARFVRDHAAPLAEKEFDTELAALHHVSAYVCRPRNGTDTLSEHAYANALDWGALELANGEMIKVRGYGRQQPRRARLLSALRMAACGPFKTVLGPGTDADHADHFHFDLAERRNGGTYCR